MIPIHSAEEHSRKVNSMSKTKEERPWRVSGAPGSLGSLRDSGGGGTRGESGVVS